MDATAAVLVPWEDDKQYSNGQYISGNSFEFNTTLSKKDYFNSQPLKEYSKSCISLIISYRDGKKQTLAGLPIPYAYADLIPEECGGEKEWLFSNHWKPAIHMLDYPICAMDNKVAINYGKRYIISTSLSKKEWFASCTIDYYDSLLKQLYHVIKPVRSGIFIDNLIPECLGGPSDWIINRYTEHADIDRVKRIKRGTTSTSISSIISTGNSSQINIF